jgi:hypothetical protein
MAEYIPQEGTREGHKPNIDNLLLDLYRLLAIFFSSRRFAELRTGTGETFDPIARLESYEEDEITRILLTASTMARVIDDRESRVFDLVSASCGTLTRSLPVGEVSEDLLLRDACNKIIHAQKIRFDVDATDGTQTYLNPVIYLYGRERGADWKATVDVVAFAKEYCWCVSHF